MKKSNSTRVKAPTNSQTPLPQSLQEAEQYDASIQNPIRRNDGPPTAGRTPSRAPIGRTAADTSDGKRAFLNAKSSIGIGTWNVRTLNQEGNLEHLLHELYHMDWEIIGLQRPTGVTQANYVETVSRFYAVVMNPSTEKVWLSYSTNQHKDP